MAGVVLPDSFPAAKAVAECRVRDRRRSGVPFSTRLRRRRVASPLHGSGAAFCITLNGEASPTAASSRLLVFSLAGATYSRHPGCRAMLSAWGRALSTGAGFVLLCIRVDQLLDASSHAVKLVAL